MSLPASAPGAAGLWLTGTWDTAGVALAVALSAAYGLGVRQVRARGLSWPRSRTAAWAAGVVSLLLATVGGIGRYAHALLWVYALQVLVLLLLTPVLLAYGRPLGLASDALPAAGSLRVVTLMTGRVAGALTSPLVGPVVVPVVLAVVFFSPVLQASLTSVWSAELLHLALLLVGVLVALGLVGDGTERESALALGAAVAIGFAEFLLDAVPGIVLRLRTHLVAPGYWATLPRAWGPAPLVDQQHAGAVLWFVAEFGDLPLMFILIRRWIRADARDAALVDHELDAREISVRSDQGDAAADGTLRPWWETDQSRLSGHRVAREYGGAGESRAERPGPD